MTGSRLGLSTLAADLGLDGHLDECRRGATDWRACRWCLWAVSIPEIDLLLGSRQDARALLDCGVQDTVPWVVAATELLRSLDALDLTEVLVPSVRRLAHRLQQLAAVDRAALDRRLRDATAVDGPLERRCLHTAATITATAIGAPGHADALGRLPASVRAALVDLSGSLSSAVQVGGLLPMVEDLHWQGLPVLRTQPEWRRRSGNHAGPGARSRQAAGAGLTAGSLEALVMESVLDRVITEVATIEDDLVGAAPPVPHVRPVHEAPHTATTRSLLWRVARIDWHLTFVDSGRATCWDSRVEDDLVVTEVPWTVAVAIDAADAHGYASATHQHRPTVTRGGAQAVPGR